MKMVLEVSSTLASAWMYLTGLLMMYATTSLGGSPYCDLFIATSPIPGAGRGVFAGRRFIQGEVIISSAIITFSHNYSLGSHLDNYVFETGYEGIDMLALNYGSLLNHGLNPNVEHYWNDADALDEGNGLELPKERIHASLGIYFVASRDIESGEEILTSYGEGMEWFTSRFGKDFSNTNLDGTTSLVSSDAPHLTAQKNCIDNSYIAESKMLLAGKGLFAANDFEQGEVISVDPVLTLSITSMNKDHNNEAEDDDDDDDDWSAIDSLSAVRNYCFWQPNSTVAFLPLGNMWAINHAIHPAEVNAVVEWESSSFAEEAQEEEEIFARRSAPFQVKLVATRRIHRHEEIAIDYGTSWLTAWMQHLSNRVIRAEARGCGCLQGQEVEEASAAIMFRRHIEASSLIFPAIWKD